MDDAFAALDNIQSEWQKRGFSDEMRLKAVSRGYILDSHSAVIESLIHFDPGFEVGMSRISAVSQSLVKLVRLPTKANSKSIMRNLLFPIYLSAVRSHLRLWEFLE